MPTDAESGVEAAASASPGADANAGRATGASAVAAAAGAASAGGAGGGGAPVYLPRRLHVSNIPFRFRESDLRDLLGVRTRTHYSS